MWEVGSYDAAQRFGKRPLPFGHGEAGVGVDSAGGNKRQAVVVPGHDSPAGVPKTGVEAEDKANRCHASRLGTRLTGHKKRFCLVFSCRSPIKVRSFSTEERAQA